MIGRFIEQQDIGFLQKQPAQSHPASFATGYYIDRGVSRRTTQGIHCHFQPAFNVPGIEGVKFFLDLTLSSYESVHLFIIKGLGKFFIDFVKLGK
jgi:hypothetical protein